MSIPAYSPFVDHWDLDFSVSFLNHGSFGASPRAILAHQNSLRTRLESEPVRFLAREAETLWWENLTTLSTFLGASQGDMFFVRHATQGVNTILKSLSFEPGDEILIHNHIYGACYETVKQVAERSGATITTAQIPFPVMEAAQIVKAFTDLYTPNVKLVFVDHITSMSGILFPIQEICTFFESKGVEVLVDGAHGPGMTPFSLNELGASYYTGNAHKWLCTPKGCAFVHVRKDKQAKIHPLITSHAYTKKVAPEHEWCVRFMWPGTDDYTAWFCTSLAIQYMGDMMGTWQALQQRNKELTLHARKYVIEQLGVQAFAPEECTLQLCTFMFKESKTAAMGFPMIHPLQDALYSKYKIEIPVFTVGKDKPVDCIRFAIQAYNSFEQIEHLVTALKELREK